MINEDGILHLASVRQIICQIAAEEEGRLPGSLLTSARRATSHYILSGLYALCMQLHSRDELKTIKRYEEPVESRWIIVLFILTIFRQ